MSILHCTLGYSTLSFGAALGDVPDIIQHFLTVTWTKTENINYRWTTESIVNMWETDKIRSQNHTNLHFLCFIHITPLFWAQKDPIQWDHNLKMAKTGHFKSSRVTPHIPPYLRPLCTVVSYVGGRTFQVKILKRIFLVSLAPLGLERSDNNDFMTPGAQKTEKMLRQRGSYVHFTV